MIARHIYITTGSEQLEISLATLTANSYSPKLPEEQSSAANVY